MLKTIIIDDEPKFTELLSQKIHKENCCQVDIIGKYNLEIEGIKAIKKLKPELVIINYSMPHLSGSEFIEILNPIDFKIIFLLSSFYKKENLESENYIVDFVKKPLEGNELQSAIFKVHSKHITQKNNNSNKLALTVGKSVRFIQVTDVVFFESDGNHSRCFLNDCTTIYTSHSLAFLETKLLDLDFIYRIHNKFLINLLRIKEFVKSEGGYLIMNNGKKVPIGRAKRKDLEKLLFESTI